MARNSYDTPIDPKARPFTARLRDLHDTERYRYQDMEDYCNRAYKTSWFQQLAVGADPWIYQGTGGTRNPPQVDLLPELSAMMHTDEATLRTWIAREWYGVGTGDDSPSPRVRSMAGALDELSDSDAQLVAVLVTRLGRRESQLRAVPSG